ncbi:branched-chain amino acid ABC transporter permease [Ktedonobacter racemifer]|uniref:Inner-membrane translocator n=1 Tax=Ktedonobacter racemifer DSM 44963 TaxID=485913 RepID=D6TST0_KTERA|nr:branched-chain amino acid ABC transporter permease [Ktedonobacter racemifer]EFH83481.1 inner-membrane translocator [Ktedonobacter racemifer DSM 44963]
MAMKKRAEGRSPALSPVLTETAGRFSGRMRGWIASACLLLFLLLLPTLYDGLFGGSANFELHRVSLIGIFVIAALAQNVLTGYAAQPSLGNAAFFGVGAYMLAWTTNDLNWPFWLGILVAMLASAVLGVIIGGPALRISGAHLAVATLGLVLITGSLLDLWDKAAGRQNYDLNTIPLWLSDDRALYFLIIVVVALLLFLSFYLLRSRVGRAWIAIRDDETAAEAFGVNITRYKLLAFVVSAVLTGLAGALYATWATTASSSMSSSDQTIAFLAMIVVGGLGSIVGSVLGALFVGFLPLLLGQLPNPLVMGSMQIQVATLTTGIYGLLLLLALIFFPHGLSGLVERFRGRRDSRGGQA